MPRSLNQRRRSSSSATPASRDGTLAAARQSSKLSAKQPTSGSARRRRLEQRARAEHARVRLFVVREAVVVAQLAGVERVKEQVDAVEVDTVNAPNDLNLNGLVSRGRLEGILIIDETLYRMTGQQELLGVGVGAQLGRVADANHSKDEEACDAGQPRRGPLDDRVREVVLEDAGQHALLDLACAAASSDLRRRLAAVARETAAAAALAARVVDDDQGAQEGHDKHVVREDDARREDAEVLQHRHGRRGGAYDEGSAGRKACDEHRQTGAPEDVRHAVRQALVDLGPCG
eukprot:scaffold64306_cov60-Phaeocystis_antarctica.AAC.2